MGYKVDIPRLVKDIKELGTKLKDLKLTVRQAKHSLTKEEGKTLYQSKRRATLLLIIRASSRNKPRKHHLGSFTFSTINELYRTWLEYLTTKSWVKYHNDMQQEMSVNSLAQFFSEEESKNNGT